VKKLFKPRYHRVHMILIHSLKTSLSLDLCDTYA
jgi:hypothetical protein